MKQRDVFVMLRPAAPLLGLQSTEQKAAFTLAPADVHVPPVSLTQEHLICLTCDTDAAFSLLI